MADNTFPTKGDLSARDKLLAYRERVELEAVLKYLLHTGVTDSKVWREATVERRKAVIEAMRRHGSWFVAFPAGVMCAKICVQKGVADGSLL